MNKINLIKLRYLLLLLPIKGILSAFLPLLIFAQPSIGQGKITSIKGQVSAPQQSSITIIDSLIPLSNEGKFDYQIALAKPMTHPIKYQQLKFPVFVEPGEQFSVSFSPTDFPKNVTFTGTSTDINTFLLQFQPINQQVEVYFNTQWIPLFSKREADFYISIDSLKYQYLNPLYAFRETHPEANPLFVQETINRTNLSLDRYLLMYSQEHPRITGRIPSKRGTVNRYIRKLKLDKPEWLGMEEYASFGLSWLEYKIGREFNKHPDLSKQENAWVNTAFSVVQKTYKNQEVKDYWLYRALYHHMDKNGIKNIEPVMEKFDALCTDAKLKATIQSFYQKKTALQH